MCLQEEAAAVSGFLTQFSAAALLHWATVTWQLGCPEGVHANSSLLLGSCPCSQGAVPESWGLTLLLCSSPSREVSSTDNASLKGWWHTAVRQWLLLRISCFPGIHKPWGACRKRQRGAEGNSKKMASDYWERGRAEQEQHTAECVAVKSIQKLYKTIFPCEQSLQDLFSINWEELPLFPDNSTQHFRGR